MFDAPKDSRPFLLRPQDKWASTDTGSQSSTPTRPKGKMSMVRKINFGSILTNYI